MADVICLGELIMDMLPSKEGKHLAEVPSFCPKPGGAPANVAVQVARMGKQSAFIGKVGEDAFGHQLAKIMKEAGVHISGLRFDRTARTTLNFIALPDINEAEFLFYRNPGADMMLTPEEIDWDLVVNSKVLYFGSVGLTAKPMVDTVYSAIELAKSHNRTIFLDANYRETLWKSPIDAKNTILSVLSNVDIVKVNEFEIELLTGGKNSLSDSCQALLNLGPELIIVTMGVNGSYFHFNGGSGHVPSFKVNSIDSSGCGDAFVGSLISELTVEDDWHSQLDNGRLLHILRFANAAGALTSEKIGVIPALPNRADVDDFLRTLS